MARAREKSNKASQHDDRNRRRLIIAQPTLGHPAYKPCIDKGILLSRIEVVVEASLGEGVAKHALTEAELGRVLSRSHGHHFSDQIAGNDKWHTRDEQANISGSLVVRIYYSTG